MACAGALTSIVMTAAGAFIANGGLSEVFGGAPVSSASGSASGTVSVTTADGFTQTMGSWEQVATATQEIGGQSWYSELTTTLDSMYNSVVEFTAPMREAWSSMVNAPVAAGNEVFMQTVGTYGVNTATFLKSVTEGAFKTAIGMGLSTAAETIGGTGTAGDIVYGTLTGDPSKLGTVLNAAQSYADTANSFINAAENAGNYLERTFISLDNTITAGINGVSNWVEGLGDDLANLGETINWDSLTNLGSPGQLLANLDFQGTLGPLYDKIANIQVDEKTARQLGANVTVATLNYLANRPGGIRVGDLGIDINQLAREGAGLPASFQSSVYRTLADLTPTEVAQVKGILNNTQAAVTQGSDLLNPQKLFAKSYETLTTPIKTASVGFRAIYENSSGSVNPQLESLGQPLEGILPSDLAVANGALSRSLQQIKNISNTNTESFADSVANMETLNDLELLQNQDTYVTQGVRDFWLDYYGNYSSSPGELKLSTGANNTLTLSDVIGYVAGYNSAAPLVENASLLAKLEAAGAFDTFTTPTTGIYAVIQQFCAGVFGPSETFPMSGIYEIVIPSGYFCAGTYTGYASGAAAFSDVWINVIVPAVVLENVSIVANYTDAKTVYDNDQIWTDQIGREYINRQRIDLDLTAIPASDQVAISLAQQLPELGKDTSFGGSAMWLERVVNVDSLGGQSVIAAMREGRNLQRLADANIQQDAPIDTQGFAEPGVLTPNQYTKEQALDIIVKS